MTREQMQRLRLIYRSIASMEATMQAQYGVNLNEVALLCMLNGCGCGQGSTAMTAGEIAEGLGLTCSNSSKVIAHVEKKGLIERRLDKGDKRLMLFTLTRAGIDFARTMRCCELPIPSELQGLI